MGWNKFKDKTKNKTNRIFHRDAATGSTEIPGTQASQPIIQPTASSATTNSLLILNTKLEIAKSDSVVKIAGPVSNSQPNSTDAYITPSDDSPRDLWKQSFQRLSPDERQQLDAFRTQEQLTSSEKAQKSDIEDLINITKKKQKEWEDRRWVLKFDGHTIVPREYMENIVNCLTFAGDIGVNFLPQPADVVWPVIKGAMQAPITAEAEIGATLTVTDLLVRYISCGTAYEKDYLPKAKDQLKKRLESALEDMYFACLKLICVGLKQLQRHTASRVARALWDPQEVQSKVSELEKSYSTLLGVTQNCQSEILNQVDDHILDFVKNFNNFESYVANNFHMVLERLDERRITETLDWISPVKERDRHDSTNTDRLPDTCEWVLQNFTFKEWDASKEKATLWLQGTLIDHLLRTTQPWEGLAYYYCKRTEGRGDEKPEDVIRSLFRQLAAPPTDQNSKISKDVQSLFLEMKNKASSPDVNICKEQLLKLVNEYSRTTIVLDALDECDKRTRKTLFDVIDRLQSHSRKPIRVFFSARPEVDIGKRFGEDSTIKTEITDVNDDIRLLIEEKVKDFQCWDDMSEEDQKQTVDKLLEKSAGMFQLVNLQIPYLMDCGLKQDVFAQLEKMPKGLTEAYKEIYDKLIPTKFQKKLVDRAFMWVMCAYEPLTTDLILAAIRLDGETEEFEEKITKSTLQGLCSNLLVCDARQGGDIWIFPHASVVEFIEEKVLDFNHAHCHAAKICLRFLMHVILSDWWDSYEISSSHINDQHEAPLTLAAKTGSLLICERLVRKGACVNQCGKDFSALSAAAYRGNDKTVQLLLDHGASVNLLLQGEYGSALAAAAWNGKDTTVQLLLDHGASVDLLLQGRYGSALTAAVWNGKDTTVQLLLDHGASVDLLLQVKLGSALAAAAWSGEDEIVQLLLDHGASVDLLLQGRYGSALTAAAWNGKDTTVQLLLDHGASVDLLLQGRYGSALTAAAWNGKDTTVQLLLDHGASVDLLLQGDYGSALAVAAWSGEDEIVQLLLHHGASVDLLLQGDYGSALAVAAWSGEDEIVQLLLHHGASVDLLLQGDYGSALAVAALGGEDEIVQLLLDHDASVDLLLQNGFYGSSLAAAAAGGSTWVVEYFIDQCNANVNLTLTTGRYGTALNAASYWGHIDCVKILLEARAIVDLPLTPQAFQFSNAFLASEALVGTKDSYKFPESECWGGRTEREMADDKQEVTRILKESVSSKAMSK
ncbi:Major facilitator superfamily domain general substrate transporter [Penicillium herquei]|nr:Major facilitator superfamily domain general substrate transporter [Penicillium herquei]